VVRGRPRGAVEQTDAPGDGPAPTATFALPRGFGSVAWGRHKNRAGAGAVAALLLALVAWMAVGAPAGAEDASEATTFGADGVATQSLGIHLEGTEVSNVVAQPDGGLLAQQGDHVEAFLPNGSPNTSFAPIPTGSEPGGLFPAAGGKAFVLDEEKLTRLSPDGTVDTSFGDAGTAKVSYDALAVGNLGSGKVLVLSDERIGARNPNYDIGVTVLGEDGSLDRSEVRSGPVSPDYSGKFVAEVVPAPDGGALVVGSGFLLRLGADGAPDPGFGHRGLLTPGSAIASAHFLADGEIEVAGSGSVAKKSGPAILRFTAAGEPDRSFGTDGVRLYDLPGAINAASWGPDGSVVLGGREEDTGSCAGKEAEEDCAETPVLAAVDAEGNLDGSFGEGGVLRLSGLTGRPGPDGYRSEGVIALARRPDGSIVAVGNAPPNESVGFVAALSPRGSLLSSFGEGGIVRAPEPVPAEERIDGFVLLPGGKVLAAGTTDVGTEERAILVRYDADGSLDSTFGAGSGFVGLPGEGRQSSRPALRDGKVLLDPYTYPHPTLQLADADDGAPLASFGSSGTVHLKDREGYATAVEFASDGDPVVLEHHPSGSAGGPIAIQRFLPNGKPDRAFGRDGRVVLRPPVHELQATALAAAPGGRILVGGFAGNRFVVVCLLPDGRPDRRFGSHGWALPHVYGPLGSMVMARVGSRLLLAGVAGEGPRPQVVLLRLDARGHRDNGFGHGGIRSAQTESDAEATTLLVTPAGPVVLLERVVEPVLDFSPGGPVRRLSISAHAQEVFAVQGTVSGGRLIVGWSPPEERPPFHLSAVPLKP
jgi:uncharacterized delta-60 repeat protein